MSKNITIVLAGLVLAGFAFSINTIVNLSSDLAILESQKKDTEKLQKDHNEDMKNAKSDCEKKVKKAIEHEKRRRDVEDKINNPDSGIINFDFGVRG